MIKREFNPTIFSDGYLTRRRLLKGIERHANRLSGRMLDFGCGSKPYESLFAVSEYIGVDIQNPSHNHDNESIDVFYDGQRLPFPDEFFDSCFSAEVFEHVHNLDEMLTEINRVLKKGGIVLVACPFLCSEHEVPIDYLRHTSFGIKIFMERHGFEVIIQEKLEGSVFAICQLMVAYFEMHITPHFRKIPILGKAIEGLIFCFFNLSAKLLEKILPKGKELYTTNLIVCKKYNLASKLII